MHAVAVGSDMNVQTKFETELRDYVASKGLQDCVHFVNKTLAVAPYLAAIDVLVQNSQARGECFGRITIEAMAFQLPVLCEARIKKLRNEDSLMQDIRSHRRAQRHWDKLRKYVTYTWGCSNLDVQSGNGRQHGTLMIDSLCGIQPMHKMKQTSTNDSTHIDLTFGTPKEMGTASEIILTEETKSSRKNCTGNK